VEIETTIINGAEPKKININMNRFLLFLLFLINIPLFYGQNLHHQMLSSQGAGVELYNGIYVSQTVGQQSVIGNSTKNGYSIGQGYQQSVWSKYIGSNEKSAVTTITYPNPFVNNVNFQFSRPINDVISIAIFDIRGRLVFQQEKKANETIVTIEIGQLPASNYLVRLSSKNYRHYTQIIKQQ
jgi:hypothetical protein